MAALLLSLHRSLPGLRRLRAAYASWRLDHIEADITNGEKTLALWRREAAALRLDIANLRGGR